MIKKSNSLESRTVKRHPIPSALKVIALLAVIPNTSRGHAIPIQAITVRNLIFEVARWITKNVLNVQSIRQLRGHGVALGEVLHMADDVACVIEEVGGIHRLVVAIDTRI